MTSQASLFDYEPGGDPPGRGGVRPEEPLPRGGRRCARCGRPLGGGGLDVAFVGRVCWDCYHKPMGRKDGRGDLSSDAGAERNVGYNLRR